MASVDLGQALLAPSTLFAPCASSRHQYPVRVLLPVADYYVGPPTGIAGLRRAPHSTRCCELQRWGSPPAGMACLRRVRLAVPGAAFCALGAALLLAPLASAVCDAVPGAAFCRGGAAFLLAPLASTVCNAVSGAPLRRLGAALLLTWLLPTHCRTQNAERVVTIPQWRCCRGGRLHATMGSDGGVGCVTLRWARAARPVKSREWSHGWSVTGDGGHITCTIPN